MCLVHVLGVPILHVCLSVHINKTTASLFIWTRSVHWWRLHVVSHHWESYCLYPHHPALNDGRLFVFVFLSLCMPFVKHWILKNIGHPSCCIPLCLLPLITLITIIQQELAEVLSHLGPREHKNKYRTVWHFWLSMMSHCSDFLGFEFVWVWVLLVRFCVYTVHAVVLI